VAIVVYQLSAQAAKDLRHHFSRLSAEDLHLRFGAVLSAQRVAAYIGSIDFACDAVFGVYDAALSLVGVAHLACGPELAELGLSVLREHRRRGIGTALFERAVMRARNLRIRGFCMHCLAANDAVMHMARAGGVRVMVHQSEADGYVELSPGDPFSMQRELIEQQLALVDYTLKTQLENARHLGLVMLGVAR
jgi:GNAT superfamily N-acetyltransferase